MSAAQLLVSAQEMPNAVVFCHTILIRYVFESSILAGTDEDLEFYVRKCGDILGVTAKLDKDHRDAKHILEHIFFQVVEFKKLNQVSESGTLIW